MRLFSGQRAFVLQRVTALALLAFFGASALRLAFGPPLIFARGQEWSAQPFGATVLLVLAVALFLHAWVGIRDVALDYVHPVALRLTVLGAAAAGLVALAAWTFLILTAHAISHLSI